MQQHFASGVALALVAVLIWGAQLPVAPSIFGAVDPFHVTAIRYGVATLLLAAFVVSSGPRHLRRSSAKPFGEVVNMTSATGH